MNIYKIYLTKFVNILQNATFMIGKKLLIFRKFNVSPQTAENALQRKRMQCRHFLLPESSGFDLWSEPVFCLVFVTFLYVAYPKTTLYTESVRPLDYFLVP